VARRFDRKTIAKFSNLGVVDHIPAHTAGPYAKRFATIRGSGASKIQARLLSRWKNETDLITSSPINELDADLFEPNFPQGNERTKLKSPIAVCSFL